MTEHELSVELRAGDGPRLVFRHVAGLTHDEPWERRPLRASAGDEARRLTYAIGMLASNGGPADSRDLNVLQAILRDDCCSRLLHHIIN